MDRINISFHTRNFKDKKSDIVRALNNIANLISVGIKDDIPVVDNDGSVIGHLTFERE